MGSLVNKGKCQFFSTAGVPLSGGSVAFYIPGTSTFKNTYQDSALSIVNPNPITLDSSGSALIWGSGNYRQVVTDSLGNQIWDEVTAVGLSGSDVSTNQITFAVDTGSVNSIIVNRLTPAASLVDGMLVSFKAMNTNTGVTNITVDGLATTPLWYSGAAVAAGVIVQGNYYTAQYQAANNIFAVVAGINNAASEWVGATTPTYISATQFSVTGNQVGIFEVNRRVKATINSGVEYGSITASSYSSPATTVTVSWDNGGAIDNTLSAIAYGLLDAVNPSVPAEYARQDKANTFTGANSFTGSNSFTSSNSFSGANSITSGGGLSFPAGALSGCLNHSQVFTANGTFTAPTAGNYIVILIGGGGGGGSGAGTNGGNNAGGGGNGGAGGNITISIVSLAANQTASVTIGAGGAGGAGSTLNGNAGANGSATYFGSYVAAGGVGGPGGHLLVAGNYTPGSPGGGYGGGQGSDVNGGAGSNGSPNNGGGGGGSGGLSGGTSASGSGGAGGSGIALIIW